MKVKEIYQKYRTPENLQEHMLRVAALGTVILDTWTGITVDTNAIVQTLLFHDIAKPVTFDISKQGQFIRDPIKLSKLKEDIMFLIDNYGTSEHSAAMKIFQEIGLSSNAQRLIDNLEWHYIEKLIDARDIESLITIYCDMRIGPKGILKISERIVELHERAPIKDLQQRLKSAKRLENLISENLSSDPNSITDELINKKSAELSQGEIV